jgi:hypothetical protein
VGTTVVDGVADVEGMSNWGKVKSGDEKRELRVERGRKLRVSRERIEDAEDFRIAEPQKPRVASRRR